MSRFTENARHKKIGWVLAEQQQQAIPGLKLYGHAEKTSALPITRQLACFRTDQGDGEVNFTEAY